MKLQDCTYGKIVCEIENGVITRIGMIKGLTNNLKSLETEEKKCPTRALTLVEWSCGHKSGIQPCHLTEFKDKYLYK